MILKLGTTYINMTRVATVCHFATQNTSKEHIVFNDDEGGTIHAEYDEKLVHYALAWLDYYADQYMPDPDPGPGDDDLPF